MDLTTFSDREFCNALRYDGAAINTVLDTTVEYRLAEAARRIERLAARVAELEGQVAAMRPVVEAAEALTLTAHEMGVVDPVSHIAVGMDLRKYAAKEHAVFDACAALAKLRQGEGE